MCTRWPTDTYYGWTVDGDLEQGGTVIDAIAELGGQLPTVVT